MKAIFILLFLTGLAEAAAPPQKVVKLADGTYVAVIPKYNKCAYQGRGKTEKEAKADLETMVKLKKPISCEPPPEVIEMQKQRKGK